MLRYLKEAFWARANLPAIGPLPLNALAVAGVGVFGFAEHAWWLLGLGLETGYLVLLATNERFQKVVDGQALLGAKKKAGEDARRAAFRGISMHARVRFEKQEAKVKEVARLSGGEGGGDAILLESDLEQLRKLCALHLRLLVARARLRPAGVAPDQETALARQVEALEKELAAGGERFSAALRESKTATLELTRQRLANAQQSRESLVEIDSDLARIEAQLDLAVENARLEGRPAAVSGNLNLLNQILESNRALGNSDTAFLENEA